MKKSELQRGWLPSPSRPRFCWPRYWMVVAVIAQLGCSPPGPRPLELEVRDGAMAPRFGQDAAGVTLSWLEPAEDGPPKEARTWTLRARRLTADGFGPAHTVVTSDQFFRNWADTPLVLGTADGHELAFWLQRLGADTYAYGIQVGSRAAKSTEPTRELGLLHADDSSPTEHGFVSMVPQGNEFQAFWLDGRAMLAPTPAADQAPSPADPSHADHGPGAMQLRSATVAADGSVGPSEILDSRVCECCQTDAAMAADGPVVAYRDRDDHEVRDIYLLRRVGGQWQNPTRVGNDGWKIPGCPVNGPAVIANGKEVGVAWFTGAQDRPRVQLAFSQDGGASFGPPILVDDQEPLGRIDLQPAAEGGAWVSWLAKEGDHAKVQVQCFRADGQPGPQFSLASTTSQRSSGVPRLARHGEDLVAVWVVEMEGPASTKRSRLASARFSARCPA